MDRTLLLPLLVIRFSPVHLSNGAAPLVPDIEYHNFIIIMITKL